MPRDEEQTYRDAVSGKIDNLQNVLELRMSTFERDARDSLSRLETKADGIEKQVKFTNGKVRKIIICIIFLAGITIGQTFTNLHDIITLLAGMF